jgi:signal transduction histidine kinase
MQRLVSDCSGRSATQIVLSLPGKPLQVHQWTLCVLHEVAREALTNAMQHARATRIELQVELRGDAVRMRVRDNGQGMRDKDRNKPGCFGLLAASERLAQIDGTLRVVSVREQGTTIEASAPLAPRARSPGDPGEAL